MLSKLSPEMLGFLFVLLGSSAIATVNADAQCRSGCGGVVPQTFKFAEGVTYQYNYEGVIDILLSSSKGQESETKVKATVLLTQQSECNQVLRVQNLQILGDSKKFGSIPDIDKPIKLNYHDGHLEDIICAENGDTQNSLNIKRAIASMFQAALKHHNTEIDVFGNCPTEFSTHKEGNIFVIKKARNLNKCAHRESIGQDYMGLAYDITSDIKTSPLLQGKLNAELRIKAGILDSSTVNEDYLYTPFSVGDEGAKVRVHSKLSFVKQSKDNPKVSCSVPKSIIFDNPYPVIPEKTVSKALANAIKDAANSIDVIVKEKSAEKFSKIVQLMRHAKKSEIITIYGQVRSGAGFNNQQIARRIFMDAVFRAGTGECVEAAMEMYKNNELTKLEGKLFFLRLSFVSHPNIGSIKGATELLGKADLDRVGVIGLGSLIRKYCQQHSCKNLAELNAFLDKLCDRLDKPTKETEEQVLSGLKALLNAGKTNANIEGKLLNLAQDKQGVTRIRSAALEAYKANPCSDKLRDSALNILNDDQQDAELRIKAYQVVAECPNGKVATNIKSLLDKEQSYQVGGYIVSHLQTLRASTNPDKAQAKAQLGNIYTTKKYPFDLLKYSRNMEMSQRWDTIGLGGSLESNIIYSPKSFVPRSTHFNLTTQLFGHTFNLLEIDTRQENFDKLLAHYFAPGGLVRKKSSNEILQESKDFGTKVNEEVKKRLSKREANKAQIETFGKGIVQKENEMNKDLELDLSIKLFGSEAIFLSFSEDVTKYTPQELLDKILNKIDEEVDKLKSFDENLHKNLVFYDADISYPTSLGFPLKLSVEGASSMNFKSAGKLDFKKSNDFKLTLIDSASIQLTSKMFLDTSTVQRGLKIAGNLYSATGDDWELTVGRKDFKLKYAFPVAKQEILTATHDIVFESVECDGQTTEVPLKQTQAKDVTVCLDQLNPYVGVIFCAHINQPNIEGNKVILPYPLNGNSKFSITVDNADFGFATIKGVVYDRIDSSDKTGMELETQVMCKQGKPKMTLKTELFNRPELYFLTTFNSEKKKASAELKAVITEQERSVFARATVDELEYYAKVGASFTGTPERSVVKPIMEYKPGTGAVQKSPFRLEGEIIKEVQEGKTKYTMDNLKMIGGPKPIQVSGSIEQTAESVGGDLTFTDGEKNGHLKGMIQYKDKHLTLNTMVKTNFHPNANFDIKYDIKVLDDLFDSNLQFQHGDLAKKENIFKLQNMFKKYRVQDMDAFSTANHMSYPKLGINNKFDLDLTIKSVKMDLEFAYQKTKVDIELDAKVNKKNVGDYDIEFEFRGLNNKIELNLERAVDKSKSKLRNSLEINGKTIKLNGDVTHLFDTNKIDFGTDLNLKITGFERNADLKIISVLKHNPQETDGSLKISDGSKVIVDSFIKHSKGGNANGSLKVNTNAISMQGQLKATKYSGTSSLVIDIPSIRKIKGESTFNLNLPTFNFDLNLQTDVGKDDTRKYRISTTSTFKENSIDSKNILEILGKTTTFNIKASSTGGVKDGKLDGDFDLTLPNDLYFAGKLNEERKTLKGIVSGGVFFFLEQRDNKNAPGRKITIKGEGKNIDVDHGSYDLVYNVILENGGGKNLNVDLDLKSSKQGDRENVMWATSVHGAIISEPIKSKISFSHEKGNGDFDVTYAHGPSMTFDMKGKFDHHHQDDTKKPSTGDFSLEMHTPLTKFRVFKVKSEFRVMVPKTKEDPFEFFEDATLFIDDDGTDPNPTIDFHSKQDWKLDLHKGMIKSMLHLKGKDPLNIDLEYDESPGKKYNSKGCVKCGATELGKWDVTIDIISKQEINMLCKIESNREQLKNLVISSKHKYVPETKTVSNNVNMNLNDEKYVLENIVGFSEHYPLFSIELKYPDGKIDKLMGKFNNIGVRSISSQTEIKLHKIPFNFDGSLDVQAESIEDFDLKLTVDSPELKLSKIVITANTKETKGTNKLFISAKKSGENLISGSAVYKTREEDGKFVVEGSGTFTIKNEKKSGNFKYMKNNLVASKHKEDGIEFSLQGSIGDKALDSEVKITDKHRRALISYCEQKKECANMELDSKTSTEGKDGFKNVLEMNVDLRKLGLSHEFGLKSETKVGDWDLDHTVDMHFQSQKSKYSYSLYLHPRKAGATLTTPKRIVALEGTLMTPELGQKGPIKGEVLFFLNKKTKPNEKSSFTFLINPEFNEKVANLNMESKLIHPALKKPMQAVYRSSLHLENPYKLEIHSEVDILPNSDKKAVLDVKGMLNQNDKIVELKHEYSLDVQPVNLKISGKGVDVADLSLKNYEVKYELTIDHNGKKSESLYHELSGLTRAFEKLKINNFLIYDVELDATTTDDSVTLNGNLQIIGLEKVTAHLEMKKANSVKFYLAKASNKNHKLELNAAFIPNQIADCRVDLHRDGKKIDFLHGSVKLDESDFMKSDYGYQGKHVKEHLVEPLKKVVQKVVEESKNAIKKTTEDSRTHLSEIAKQIQDNKANFQPIGAYYEKEMNTIKAELESDETLKKISKALATLVSASIQFIDEMTKVVVGFNTKMLEILQQYTKDVAETFEKEILPKLQELANKLTDLSVSFITGFNDVLFNVVQQISNFFESHKEEMKQIVTVLTSLTQDINRIVMKISEEIKESLTKQYQRILEDIKVLPYYEEIKTMIHKIEKGEPVPQQYIDQFEGIVSEILNHVHIPAIKEIIDYTAKYLVKKMKREEVDDVKALEHIVKSTIDVIKDMTNMEALKDATQKTSMPLPMKLASLIPKFVAMQYSFLNRIIAKDLPSLEEIFSDFTLNPLSMLPPFRRYAIIAQGQHIFTFDGKHLTFPGKCNYLLARDVDGHFSIVGTYVNGIMTELTFFDKTDTITIKKSGAPTLNGAANELPIRTKTTDAYRLYDQIQIASKTGVKIYCSPDLMICVFSVSGFYHNKLRGLLGNANHEMFDDYVLPNGKIVQSESDFGNAYKMQGDCPAVNTVDHSTHHHEEECNKLFSSTSYLAPCYPIVKPDLFRQACDHGIASKVPSTTEAIATAYAAACQVRFIPILLPKDFVKCTNSETPYSLRDTFSVKIPQKAADIVFAIDVTTQNKQIYAELVTALGEQLKKELSERGVKDVEFHIITYGDHPEYPSHITTNGGKLTFKGKFPNLKFSDKTEEDGFRTDIKQIDFILDIMESYYRDLKLAVGDTPQEYAYEEAISYPFRAHAVKTIIAVTTAPCETGAFILGQKLRALLLSDPTINVHVFTPMASSFKVKDDKTTKNVIGFNKNFVLTFPDCKKKPTGNADLVKDVSHSDFCSEYAVKSGGNVFVLNNFPTATKPNKKFYTQVASYNIAESMLMYEQGLDCQCIREDLISGRNECKVVTSKRRPASDRKLTRG